MEIAKSKAAAKKSPKVSIQKLPEIDPNKATVSDAMDKCNIPEDQMINFNNEMRNIDLKMQKKIDHLQGEFQKNNDKLERKIKYNTDEEEDNQTDDRMITSANNDSKIDDDAKSQITSKSIKSKNRHFNDTQLK